MTGQEDAELIGPGGEINSLILEDQSQRISIFTAIDRHDDDISHIVVVDPGGDRQGWEIVISSPVARQGSLDHTMLDLHIGASLRHIIIWCPDMDPLGNEPVRAVKGQTSPIGGVCIRNGRAVSPASQHQPKSSSTAQVLTWQDWSGSHAHRLFRSTGQNHSITAYEVARHCSIRSDPLEE